MTSSIRLPATARGTPIYGMPILDVDAAKNIIICNFDEKPGYAGVDNPLYSDTRGNPHAGRRQCKPGETARAECPEVESAQKQDGDFGLIA